MRSGSILERTLEKGHFAVTAEVGPPKSANIGLVTKKAEGLRGYVDAINLTDNQTAIVRLSSIASGAALIRMGLEPVVQMVARDRNRIAMQSDILGAYALGMKNLLCLSGDHQSFGNHPGSKNVYDIDSIQMLSMFKNMRDEARFLNGDTIKTPPELYIGAAANPFADPFEFRVVRLAKKVEAGADFIQTQAIYDLEKFEQWMEMVRDWGLHEKVHILGGIVPLKSLGAAKYIKYKVSGMSVPDELITRMKEAPDKKAEGLAYAIETIERLKSIEGVHGVHIMAIAWEEKVPEIVQRTGLYPRPQPQPKRENAEEDVG